MNLKTLLFYRENNENYINLDTQGLQAADLPITSNAPITIIGFDVQSSRPLLRHRPSYRLW